MVEQLSGTTPSEYASILRRRWLWVVLVLGLAMLAGGVYLAVAPKVYSATASVLVTPSIGLDAANSASGRTSADVNLDTEAQIVQSTPVASAAAKLLRTEDSPANLVESVSVSVPANTTVLAISYQAPTATAAMEGAHAFAQAYLDLRQAQAKGSVATQIAAIEAQISAQQKQLREVSARIAEAASNSPDRAADEAQRAVLVNQIQALNARLLPLNTTDVTAGAILTDAMLPTAPTSPDRFIVLGSALALGLLLGLGLALLVDRADRRVRRRSDVTALGLEVLIAGSRAARNPVLVTPATKEYAFYSELRVMVLAGLESGRGTVMLAPVGISQAGGVAAANLAATAARSGLATVLVATEPNSVAARLLGAGGEGPTLALALRGERLQPPVAQRGWPAVLPAGAAVQLAAEQAQGPALERVFAQLREHFELIILEAPAVEDSPLGLTFAGVSDAVVLVVQQRRTSRAGLAEAARRLRTSGARILGTVLLDPGPRRSPAVAPDVLRPAADGSDPAETPRVHVRSSRGPATRP